MRVPTFKCPVKFMIFFLNLEMIFIDKYAYFKKYFKFNIK